jgi:Bacterial regulatory helix-turn-helix protein, lysR family
MLAGVRTVSTFEQLEAVFWIAQLGGFAAAAKRLHTTQSAISKRVHELESTFRIEMVCYSRKNATISASASADECPKLIRPRPRSMIWSRRMTSSVSPSLVT